MLGRPIDSTMYFHRFRMVIRQNKDKVEDVQRFTLVNEYSDFFFFFFFLILKYYLSSARQNLQKHLCDQLSQIRLYIHLEWQGFSFIPIWIARRQ